MIFFRFVADANEPTPLLVEAFLNLEQPQALALVLRYKNHLRDVRCLKEATINRRLAALKALVRLANQLGNVAIPSVASKEKRSVAIGIPLGFHKLFIDKF